MPYHLNIHFSAKSSETQTRLLLMHEDEGILNKVDEGLTEKLMAACNSADFTGKSGRFLPVHSTDGLFLIAGVGKGLDTGLSAETWGGHLFSQMKSVPFNSLQIDADLMPTDIILSVLSGALSAS